MAEALLSSKNLMSNYTASILQAPAFAPTPHSKITFNEGFRSNQYVAAGIIPVFTFNEMLHLRIEGYGFLPLYPIEKEQFIPEPYTDIPRYGKMIQTFRYMGEAALVLNLPFVSVSLFANGYSYPKNDFNVGLNIGFLIFNPRFLE